MSFREEFWLRVYRNTVAIGICAMATFSGAITSDAISALYGAALSYVFTGAAYASGREMQKRNGDTSYAKDRSDR